jgi:tRNA-Thr(GGU) m(6)t(6)A37 methyltransferase TsaA
MEPQPKSFRISPIGTVGRTVDQTQIRIAAPYRAALKGLNTFSHVIVFWWAERYDNPEQRQVLTCELPYAPGHEAGVFACRSPLRPNLIMTTVCKILAVDEQSGVVQIANIDAFDGTPVLDLKPYFPVVDRVQDAHISDFLTGWPEWLPEEGIGLMEGE